MSCDAIDKTVSSNPTNDSSESNSSGTVLESNILSSEGRNESQLYVSQMPIVDVTSTSIIAASSGDTGLSPARLEEERESERRVWTVVEDEAIKQLVTKFGTKSWSLIAEHIYKDYQISGRSGKQCRERWHNHLGLLGQFFFLSSLFLYMPSSIFVFLIRRSEY